MDGQNTDALGGETAGSRSEGDISKGTHGLRVVLSLGIGYLFCHTLLLLLFCFGHAGNAIFIVIRMHALRRRTGVVGCLFSFPSTIQSEGIRESFISLAGFTRIKHASHDQMKGKH